METRLLHTQLVWRVATQCHFAIHSTRICQLDSWAIEPCIFATSMLENIPAIPCPRDDVAMFEMLFGAYKRNWDKPFSASPLLQDMQLPTFFWDRHTALFGSTAADRKPAMERISLRQKMFTLDPTVLLRRCFGLSQHFVPGAMGARIVTESIWSTKCLPCSCHDSTLIERFRVE